MMLARTFIIAYSVNDDVNLLLYYMSLKMFDTRIVKRKYLRSDNF